jgi:Ca2+-binding RTX toxin-like protein
VLIDGGAGHDKLSAGGGSAVLLGGAGNDVLRGGRRRDLIIGGLGADRLDAKAGSDMLIAGWTAYDANYEALFSILAEWNSGAGYRDRVARQSSGSAAEVRPSAASLVRQQTVFDDQAVDTLLGGGDLDWFLLSSARDRVLDKLGSESTL